jgi:hypothetical protein
MYYEHVFKLDIPSEDGIDEYDLLIEYVLQVIKEYDSSYSGEGEDAKKLLTNLIQAIRRKRKDPSKYSMSLMDVKPTKIDGKIHFPNYTALKGLVPIPKIERYRTRALLYSDPNIRVPHTFQEKYTFKENDFKQEQTIKSHIDSLFKFHYNMQCLRLDQLHPILKQERRKEVGGVTSITVKVSYKIPKFGNIEGNIYFGSDNYADDDYDYDYDYDYDDLKHNLNDDNYDYYDNDDDECCGIFEEYEEYGSSETKVVYNDNNIQYGKHDGEEHDTYNSIPIRHAVYPNYKFMKVFLESVWNSNRESENDRKTYEPFEEYKEYRENVEEGAKAEYDRCIANICSWQDSLQYISESKNWSEMQDRIIKSNLFDDEDEQNGGDEKTPVFHDIQKLTRKVNNLIRTICENKDSDSVGRHMIKVMGFFHPDKADKYPELFQRFSNNIVKNMCPGLAKSRKKLSTYQIYFG